MESKILNLPEALRLAQIVSKYVNPDTLKAMTGNVFVYEVFGELSSQEIADVFELLEVQNQISPEDGILLAVGGMMQNNLVELLDAYKQIGFK